MGMDVGFLLRGLVIGFSIAAPVGPIGVLCIRRTLAQGRIFGLLSGLGAASADAIYGCVAALGLALVSNFLVSQQFWLRLVGGVFLCFLGVRAFVAKPSEDVASLTRSGLVGAYVSTFLLTLSNPVTILSFAAVFAGFGVAGGSSGSYVNAAILVLGVFVGSALWWLILTGFVGLFRSKFNPDRLRWVNRISGILIVVFGLVILLSLRA